MKTSIITSKLLQPAKASSTTTLLMSNLDQIMPPYYLAFIFSFPEQGSDGISCISTPVLEDSISQLLVEFYPVAGRLKVRQNGKAYVECNDKGILFMEAVASGTLADGLKLEPSQQCSLLVPNVNNFSSESPFVCIQLTRFNCGGSSLTLAVNHKLGDAQTLSFFLKKWSDIVRKDQQLGIGVGPTFEHPKLMNLTTRSVEHYNLPQFFPASPPPQYPTMKVFTFQESTLKLLKKQASDFSGGSIITRFQCLAGHLWHSMTKARKLTPDEQSTIGITMDARRRLTPPLPMELFGNVVMMGIASSSVNQLLECPHSVPMVIQEAIAKVDQKAVEYQMHQTELGVENSSLPPNGMEAFSKGMVITSCWSIPLVDFGWGQASSVMLPTLAADVVCCVLLPPGGPKYQVLVGGITPEELNTLESDPLFLYER